MNKTISVIGGDYRIIKLIQMLRKEGFLIKTVGLEKSEEIFENEKSNLEDCINFSKIIISSIPFSKNGRTVYTPFSENELIIENIKQKLDGKILIAGNVKIDDKEKNFEIHDLMQDEPLTIANAISTAEGAIEIVIKETEKTIHGSKILILGFGRIGKILAKDLNGLGAEVTCEARKESDLTWINTYGYKSLDLKNLKENINKFDIIFNTIPYIVLDKEMLNNINKDVFIIDLASKPGGVDFVECDRLGIKYNWALALPGKVAPITSAEWIKKAIYNIIE